MRSNISRRRKSSHRSNTYQAPPFQYNLLPGPTSIRLLRLEPSSSHHKPLRVHLLTTSLAQAPPYGALSYVWADPPDITEILFCGHHSLRIPLNLARALRRLRDKATAATAPHWLWADSICINQNDLAERAQQVTLMGEVYSRAAEVVVWLGLADADTKRAFGAIEASWRWLGREFLQGVQEGQEYPFDEMPTLELETVRSMDQEDVHAVARLFAREWWKRMWCIQEVGLARRRKILCGPHELSWEALTDFAYYVQSKGDVLAVFYNADVSRFFRSWMHFTAYKDEWKHTLCGRHTSESIPPWHPDIIDVLDSAYQHVATDPHDNIYAFLGHPCAQHEGRPIMTPDYEHGHHSAYTEFAKSILTSPSTIVPKGEEWVYGRGHLRSLSYVWHDDTDLESVTDLPSWVPKWNLRNPCSTLGSGFYHYEAGGLETSEPVLITGDELQLRGISIDSVCVFTEELAPHGFDTGAENPPSELVQILELWKAALEIRAQRTLVDEGETREMMKALSFTLTADLLDSESAVERHIKHFSNLSAYMSNMRDADWWPSLATDIFSAEFIKDMVGEMTTNGDSNRFMIDLLKKCAFRRVFYTAGNRFGLGPTAMKSGDVCCVLFGSAVPFVARKEGERYRLVGEAYLHGVMQGECLSGSKLGDGDVELFRFY